MRQSWAQFKRVIPYLPTGTVEYVRRYVIVSSLLTLLDIGALMLLALSLSGMLAGTEVVIPIVNWIVLPKDYVWLLLAVSLLILLKSSLSLLQQWFATRRFSEFELVLGMRLFDAYIGAPWLSRLTRSTAQLVRMADVGVAALVNGLLMPLMQLPAAIISTFLILVTLLFVQPMTALISILYLGLIAFLMSFVLSRKSLEAGNVNLRYSYRVATLMTDMVGALKEITLQNKLSEVGQEIRRNRQHATRARANLQFLGAFPKFVTDAALIGGFLIVGGASYLVSHSLNEAIGAVVLFAVTGMRLIPGLVIFQSTTNTLNGNRAQVDAVLGDLQSFDEYRLRTESLGKERLEKNPEELRLQHVTFTYPSREDPAVNDVSMTIRMGTRIGIVGESGSGKSTLVDIILGLLIPQSGKICIDEQQLEDVLGEWRLKVGYVPQDVSLFDGTIAQNVALTWHGDIDEEKVVQCLKRAQLWKAVKDRPGGLSAQIGERGIALSGGQRQRLGIARALYSDPYILIMDEATSALDTKTESKITDSLKKLHGEVTVISVAHRLSTVRDADQLFYMEDGLVLANGTFDEVVDTVPSFREQAALAGLLGPVKPQNA